jgi:hypothetical protein
LRSQIVAGALVALVLAAAAIASMPRWMPPPLIEKLADKRYGRKPPAWHEPAPHDAVEARRQDLRYLAALPDVDLTFSLLARERFHAALEQLSAHADTLDTIAFDLGLAHAVAQSGNAHTAVDANLWREILERVPVSFAWFPDGLRIVRVTAGHEDLLGTRVTSLDGEDPQAWLPRIAQYVPGIAQHVRAVSPLFLEAPAALHVMQDRAPADRMDLTVMQDGAAPREVMLEALPAHPEPERLPNGGVARNVVPPSDARATRGVLARDALPPSLRDSDRLSHHEILAPGVLYLHLWRVSRAFGPEVDGEIRAAIASGPHPWGRIVLDLRYNGGGEYPAVYWALRALVDSLAPDGHIAILTNDATFSGAIIVTALVKHFAGARAVVVGEPAGDRLQFWAEGDDMVLPNSKIHVHTATGYHDWANGCRELRCYWPNFWYSVAVGSIAPDVVVPWDFADYRRGVDPVVAAALQVH